MVRIDLSLGHCVFGTLYEHILLPIPGTEEALGP